MCSGVALSLALHSTVLFDGLDDDSGPNAETEIDGLASDEVDSTSLSLQTEGLKGDGWMSDVGSKLPREAAFPYLAAH